MTEKRVLIVDDDQDFADSLSDMIKEEGYRTYTAYSGKSAVDMICKEQMDIVFMDIRMPDMNGLQTFEKIRAINPEMQIAMMSGYTDEEISNTLLKRGAVTILPKPVSLQDILMIIENSGNQRIILIIDDDHDFTQSLKLMLEERGNKVLVANSLAEALEFSNITNIKIVLLDLRLNGENGLTVFQTLSKSGLEFETIVITAYSKEEAYQIGQLRSLSVQHFMKKPFDPETLINRIKSVWT